MNRQQAVDVIKEIFQECHTIEGRSLKFLPPQSNNALSDTYQIHIEKSGVNSIEACVQSIAKKHNFSVKTKDRWLIVYKPYPNLNEP
jgi:hypothetical protein